MYRQRRVGNAVGRGEPEELSCKHQTFLPFAPAVLLEPFAIACMMQVYFKTIEGQTPNPEWEAKLEQMSGKFRKLKERAFGASGAMPADGDSARVN